MRTRRAGHITRDEKLGAALRALGAPPPDPEFYVRLVARLEAEADAPTEEQRPWRPPRRAIPIAALAVAAAVVGSVVLPRGGLGPFTFGPRPAAAVTADEVRAKVQDAFTSSENLQGEATLVRGNSRGDETTQRFRFIIGAEGDFRVTELDGRRDLSYRASDGLQRSLSRDANGATALAAESRGLATGPPDPSPTASVLLREMGALVRSFVGSQADVPVVEEDYQGRAAWRLVVPVDLEASAPPGQEAIARKELDVTVDQDTGFPLRTTDRLLRSDGSIYSYSDVQLSELQSDQALGRDAFALEFPGDGIDVTRLDYGFQRVDLGAVQDAVGYRPLTPALVPSGFSLAEVAVARQAATTAGGRNPPSRNVVSLAFQRGFNRFVLTMRATGAERRAWVDPLLEPGAATFTARPFAPSAGALRSGSGEIVRNSVGGPHAWVLTDGLVVTLTGDLSEEEIVMVLESL